MKTKKIQVKGEIAKFVKQNDSTTDIFNKALASKKQENGSKEKRITRRKD